jgi:hypothetical protein
MGFKAEISTEARVTLLSRPHISILLVPFCERVNRELELTIGVNVASKKWCDE